MYYIVKSERLLPDGSEEEILAVCDTRQEAEEFADQEHAERYDYAEQEAEEWGRPIRFGRVWIEESETMPPLVF